MDDGKKRVYCCHALATEEDTWYGVRNEDMTRTLGELNLYTRGDMKGPDLRRLVPYTMKLFEQSPGDAVEFFSQRFKWSEKDKRLVNKIDPYLRLACRKCKQDYNLIKFVLEKHAVLMEQFDLDGDMIHGQFAYSVQLVHINTLVLD
ncbi:hypothetical protein ACHAXN_005763, partial [Cyclotella atomus]